MKSIFKRAIATLSICALFCIHSIANAEETKTGSTAQSGVAEQNTKESQDAAAKAAKTDDSKKKASSTGEAEPECNN